MGEYYDRARALSESARPKLAPVLPNKRKKHCMFDLAQHYNVSDMTDFLGSTLSEQTIDEEYLSYSMGLLESRDFTDADILTFWEVSTLAAALLASDELMMRCDAAMPDRQTNSGFRRYLPSRLTTSLSRLRLSHAKGFSPQVRKLTQSDATESIHCSWRHFNC